MTMLLAPHKAGGFTLLELLLAASLLAGLSVLLVSTLGSIATAYTANQRQAAVNQQTQLGMDQLRQSIQNAAQTAVFTTYSDDSQPEQNQSLLVGGMPDASNQAQYVLYCVDQSQNDQIVEFAWSAASGGTQDPFSTTNLNNPSDTQLPDSAAECSITGKNLAKFLNLQPGSGTGNYSVSNLFDATVQTQALQFTGVSTQYELYEGFHPANVDESPPAIIVNLHTSYYTSAARTEDSTLEPTVEREMAYTDVPQRSSDFNQGVQ